MCSLKMHALLIFAINVFKLYFITTNLFFYDLVAWVLELQFWFNRWVCLVASLEWCWQFAFWNLSTCSKKIKKIKKSLQALLGLARLAARPSSSLRPKCHLPANARKACKFSLRQVAAASRSLQTGPLAWWNSRAHALKVDRLLQCAQRRFEIM
jgi:hypothetical protein